MPKYATAEAFWTACLTGSDPTLHRGRQLMKALPSDPRCKLCNIPFGGVGGFVMRRLGRRPWPHNPRFCGACFTALGGMPGGAEVDSAVVFADVRGSTPMAERLGPAEFGHLMNRFFAVATHALIEADGFVEKFVGDEVVGVWVPGWAGPHYVDKAIDAARRILRDTGHGDAGTPPWVPVGVGVHAGRAFVGTVGTAGEVTDFSVLGDIPNVAARLATVARAGEILVTEEAAGAAHEPVPTTEQRAVELRGVSHLVRVRVLTA